MIESSKVVMPIEESTDSVKMPIDILNNTEGVEVATPFWVSAVEVLKNESKETPWLKMPEPASLPWMHKQVDKIELV